MIASMKSRSVIVKSIYTRNLYLL